MFKNEIKREMKNQLNSLSQSDFKIVYLNEAETLVLIGETEEFRFIYEGKKVLTKWKKGKALFEEISSNGMLRDLYKVGLNCIANGLDIEEHLQMTL